MMYDGLCNPGKGLIIDQPGCLSMCPALNVPGSSVKSLLNIEYALCRIKKWKVTSGKTVTCNFQPYSSK
jgi:UDP-N-acetylglucosamine pyrophosphorylase